jgi:protein-S-isoprenylcysteine O-methyltransferase Ste14
MNTLRYFLALILLISLPALFLYWLLVHPLINLWRAKGIGITYSVILAIIALAMIALFSIRHYLLTVDFGTSYPLVALGIVCLLLSAKLRLTLQKHMTVQFLLGLPEIAPDRHPRTLVTEGLYSRVRHPRYIQFLIALVGYSLIANYLALYIVTALWLPAVYTIVLLEERELRQHFGELYNAYCRKVPRFIPKMHVSKNRRET